MVIYCTDKGFINLICSTCFTQTCSCFNNNKASTFLVNLSHYCRNNILCSMYLADRFLTINRIRHAYKLILYIRIAIMLYLTCYIIIVSLFNIRFCRLNIEKAPEQLVFSHFYCFKSLLLSMVSQFRILGKYLINITFIQHNNFSSMLHILIEYIYPV